jgi:fatty acid desaturase
MKDNPENGDQARGKRRAPTWRSLAIAAAILAVIQACLTIEGRGIEGFILWVLIFFVGYWLFFTFLVWLLGRLRERK